MFGDRERVVATGIIWAALALIMIFARVDTSNFMSLGVLVGGAFFATSAVWDSAKSQPKENQTAARIEVPEKAKRSEDTRLSRLVESLSEDDIAALEAVLAARRDQFDEDEQIELNRLLADQERTRR